MCKAKKKVTERDKGSPCVKERRKKEIGDNCQAMKKPNVKIRFVVILLVSYFRWEMLVSVFVYI